MLKNYLIIALRNLWRHKGYAFINIAGLAVGIACCLLMLLFVHHEWSYDRFHTHADRIYRVLLEDTSTGARSEGLPEPVIPGLQATYPEIEQGVRVNGPINEVLVMTDDKQGYEDGFLMAEPSFFELFSFLSLQGDPVAALAEPGAIVLTERMARSYFGNENPIGQSMTVGWIQDETYTVKAVVEDPPSNSHLQFQMIAYRPEEAQKSWNYRYGSGYVLLGEHASPMELEQKLPAFVERSVRAGAEDGHIDTSNGLRLQPLPEIHLHPDLNAAATKSGPVLYLYLFSGAALLILLIACINYMNLATARSARRAREVGVRKVVGAGRGQIAGQFLLESMLISLGALVLALVLVELLLPVFGSIVGVAFSLHSVERVAMMAVLTGLVVVVGLVSGSYPALLLSGFQPTRVLKGDASRSGGASGLRKLLVVFQFAASVVLILATVTIQQQMEYVRTARLNAHDDQIVVVTNHNPVPEAGEPSAGLSSYDAFKQALLAQPGIAAVTTGQVPGAINSRAVYVDSIGTRQTVNVMSVGADYLKTLGLTLVAGHDFTAEAPTISRPVIVNQAALRWLNLENPIGQHVQKLNNGTIVGVVSDFHMLPMYDTVDPLVIQPLQPGSASDILVRLEMGRIARGLASIQDTWEQFVPEWPLLYEFLDDRLDQAYHAELRMGRIFSAVAVVAILIACLGLFGLSAFTAEQRTKEVGIRKVLGASISSIVALLSTGFVRLVLIAIVIATPVAYVGMQRWLDDFAYRIELSGWTFLMAGLAALVIALVTVSYQAIKAALADPVKSLRYE